ncbi:hypothetical protein NEOLI_004076, partial [Neolecta irregularis DAH-3]
CVVESRWRRWRRWRVAVREAVRGGAGGPCCRLARPPRLQCCRSTSRRPQAHTTPPRPMPQPSQPRPRRRSPPPSRSASPTAAPPTAYSPTTAASPQASPFSRPPSCMMAQPGQLPPMPSWDDKPKPVPKYAEFPVEVEKPENAHHQSSQSPAENVHFGQAYTAARALQEQRKSPKPGPPHASASALAEYQDYGESAYSHAGYASPSSYNSTAKYQPAPPYDSYPAAYTSATNYSTPTRFSSHKNATAYSQARSGEYPPGQPSSARYGPQYSTQNSYDPHKLRSNDRNYPNPSSSPHYAPIPPRHAEPPRLKGPRINTTTAPQEGAYSNGQSAANYIDV